ncbi:MAG: hypothetical protein ACI9UV_001240 [Algoriphagus sp.]|jgi:hypothetical protein
MEGGYSKQTLHRYFASCFCRPPKLSFYLSEQVNLLIDGNYFSLVLYRKKIVKFTQFYRQTNKEKFEGLKEYLESLLSLGVNIESINCGRHRTLLKSFHKKLLTEALVLQK